MITIAGGLAQGLFGGSGGRRTVGRTGGRSGDEGGLPAQAPPGRKANRDNQGEPSRKAGVFFRVSEMLVG